MKKLLLVFLMGFLSCGAYAEEPMSQSEIGVVCSRLSELAGEALVDKAKSDNAFGDYIKGKTITLKDMSDYSTAVDAQITKKYEEEAKNPEDLRRIDAMLRIVMREQPPYDGVSNRVNRTCLINLGGDARTFQ